MEVRFTLDLDKKEFEEKVRKEFTKKWQEQSTSRLNALFADVTKRNWFSETERSDPSFGLMCRHVDDLIKQHMDQVDLDVKIKAFLDRNLDKYLEDAMDEALRHHTRKVAFSQIKEQAPREHKE